jgi:hypothetical protein
MSKITYFQNSDNIIFAPEHYVGYTTTRVLVSL